MQYWIAVRARPKLVLLTVVAGFLAALIVTLSQVPVYRTRGSVRLPESGPDAYATHVRMLQSESVKAKALSKLRFQAAQFPPGPSDHIGGWRSTLGLRSPGPEEAIDQAVSSFEARSAGSTAIVDLYCESSDRRIAASYVNLVAAEYVSLVNSGGSPAESRPSSSDEIERARRDLEQSEAGLEKAEKSRAGPVADIEERLRDLDRQLERAHIDGETKASSYASARSANDKMLAALTGDAPMQTLLGQLDAAQTKLGALQTTLTDKHPSVVEAQAAVNNLQHLIEARRADIILQLRLEAGSAQHLEEALKSEIARSQLELQKNSDNRPLLVLRREAEANRQNYEQLLARSGRKPPATPQAQASVVDGAAIPSLPYKPAPFRNLAFGCCAGLLLGVLCATLMARVDHSVQAPEDAAECTGVAELGIIPEMNVRGRSPEFRVELAVSHDRLSPTARAYTAAATSLLFLFNDRPGGGASAVVLTSAGPMDGKTTTACNLSVAVSEARRRVLLVDADVLKPRISSLFGLRDEPGLTDLLQSSEPIDQALLNGVVQSSQFVGLDVLASGLGGERTAELLNSPRLPELLAVMRSKYDFIVIDTPPMIQIPHARVFGRMSEGVVLVARAGRTNRESLHVAASRLREDGVRILGTVLNGWNPRVGGYGHGAYTQTYKSYGTGRG